MNKTTVSIILLSVCAMQASHGSYTGLPRASIDPVTGRVLLVRVMHVSDDSCMSLRRHPASGWWVCNIGWWRSRNYCDFVAPEVSGTIALHRAAKSGDIDRVRKLLHQNVFDINIQNDDGETPLHYAAANGHVDVVRELLAGGANVNVGNKIKKTPLHCAAGIGNENITRQLLAYGADREAQSRSDCTPADQAKLSGHNDLAQLICNWKDSLGIKEPELD